MALSGATLAYAIEHNAAVGVDEKHLAGLALVLVEQNGCDARRALEPAAQIGVLVQHQVCHEDRHCGCQPSCPVESFFCQHVRVPGAEDEDALTVAYRVEHVRCDLVEDCCLGTNYPALQVLDSSEVLGNA